MKAKLFLGFIALFSLGSCSVKTVQPTQEPPLHGDFQITSFENFNDPAANLTINFDSTSKKVSGHSGCNRFFGTYETSGNTLTLKQMASTRMACIDQNISKTEAALLKTFESVKSYSLENNNLRLKNEQGSTIVSAKPFEFKMDKDYILSYEISGMMGAEKIIHAKNMMTCEKFENGKELEPIVKNLSAQDNKDILDAVAELPLDQLNTLEAPSEERHLDGASAGRFYLKHQGKEYKVPDFDHGNPPSALARIIALVTNNNPCK